MLPAADREIRLGLWKVHILHHARTREVWGTWLLEELAEHGHRLSPGTLYPALTRMEMNGWLRRTGTAAHARARQTFRITAEGRRLLEALRRDVTELYEETVLGREPGHQKKAPPKAVRGRTAKETAPRPGNRSAHPRHTVRRRS
jgi:PadR family transcriptional regulator, regulatory protein PadR